MNDMSLKLHFQLRCVHEDSRDPIIRFQKLLKKKKGVCELLNIVLKQPVRLRPENNLGREKEGGSGAANRFMLCLVNLQMKGIHFI